MRARWSVEQADVLNWFAAMPADSLSLVFGSPPYEAARLYLENGQDKKIARNTDSWVAWMVDVYRAAQRACRGLVAFVVEGQTKNYRYSAGPLLLAAELHRAGFNLRKPPAFARVGIPGSGGPDWLRNDYEFIICTTRPGRLLWSDPTAMGHQPKWAPGGAMSHRVSSGARVNQWGHPIATGGTTGKRDAVTCGKPRPSHVLAVTDDNDPTLIDYLERPRGTATDGHANGDAKTVRKSYDPPKKANPGNIIRCNVGGGLMGHSLAHENEAPFPLALAEFFVRSFAPPGGLVADPFTGSGTTGHACVVHGRQFVGCDLRESQVNLARRRLSGLVPCLPGINATDDEGR